MGSVQASLTSLEGQLVDLHQRRIYPARLTFAEGTIAAVDELASAPSRYLMPGFIDAHVHVESSMLTPAEFARAAVVHGTVATVSDPHEIGNVLGVPGVKFMLDEGEQVPLKFCFGAPSCVPATCFETAGAQLDAAAIAELLRDDRIGYLSEMMNYPGVLHDDPEVLAKIAAAKQLGKPVDGHAPGLRGADAARYIAAGITTDHECTTLAEAMDKLENGCRILIREGSAAKNYEALKSLLQTHPDRCMLCTDDNHPDDLQEGHIDRLVQRAVGDGADRLQALRASSLNVIDHYRLPVGTLRVGDPADFIVVDDLESFRVRQTYIDGVKVAEEGQPLFEPVGTETPNRFGCHAKQPSDFGLAASSDQALAMEALDGELITNRVPVSVRVDEGWVRTDPERDLLKITVVNRYQDAPPAMALIRGFGITRGAIASSVAHDSHNIVAVGVNDESICAVVNEVISHKGGLAVTDGQRMDAIKLPVAGLMCRRSCRDVGQDYARLSALAREMGSPLTAPLMTLSFMALPVIPSLKLTDRGLFDVDRFAFASPLV
ncbi:MAG: adenine deaminase [Planctomycetota bacterium]